MVKNANQVEGARARTPGRSRAGALFAMLLASVAPGAVLAAGEAHAQSQVVDFDIPEQPVHAALVAFARQAGVQLVMAETPASGVRANQVRGAHEPERALALLLQGTGYEAGFAEGAIRLRRGAGNDPTYQRQRSQAGDPVVQFAQADAPIPDTVPLPEGDPAGAPPEDEIVVTGTRIQGVADQFSPVTRIDRDDMDLAGQATVADVFAALPQNFGGGVTANTGVASSLAGPGSAAVNLRGLGNEATLTLLNGRRLAPGGTFGDFVDISTIPTSAVDRIEVVSDGASAIYGSDAIAGVVNIILRDDFDGAETRLGLGAVTDGGGRRISVGQTLGLSSAHAHGLINFEYTSEDELNANDKEFAAGLRDPNFLLPLSQTSGVFASGGVQPNERIRLSADGYYNTRYSKGANSSDIFGLLEDYTTVDSAQFGGAFGLDWRLVGDWQAEAALGYSASDQVLDFTQVNFGVGGRRETTGEVMSVDASIGGDLFRIGDEALRLVFGGHYRSESFDLFWVGVPDGAIVRDFNGERDVYALFAELYAPLVSGGNALPGINHLALSLAARYDHYTDVGQSIDPKVGVVWSPIDGVNLRGTWGTAFRAPRLDQLVDEISGASLALYADPAADIVILDLFGTKPDLSPEQAETWTIGFEVEPRSAPGLHLSASYFSIVYEDRLAEPSVGFDDQFRFTDFAGVLVRNPDPALVQSYVDRAVSFANFSDFFPIPPLTLDQVTAIQDRRVQNLSASTAEGVDVAGSYSFSTDSGDWSLSVNATLLTEYTQQPSTLTPVRDLLGTFGNPVDLRVRGGATWRRGAITTGAFFNYVGGYTDDKAPDGPRPVDSWTTFDASVQLDLGAAVGGRLAEGVTLTLNTTNLTNEDPPFIVVGPLRSDAYDPTNADPSGRRIALQLTKRW